MSFDRDKSQSSDSSEPRQQPMGLDKELPLALAQSPDPSQDGLIPAAEAVADGQFFAHQLSPIFEMDFDTDESELTESSEPRRQPFTLDKGLTLALEQSPDPSQVHGLVAAAETGGCRLEVVPIETDHAQYETASPSPFMRQGSWTTNCELTPKQDTT